MLMRNPENVLEKKKLNEMEFRVKDFRSFRVKEIYQIIFLLLLPERH